MASVAAGVLLATSSSVGIPLVDALYRAALVASCCVCGSRARRWSLLIASALVSVGSDGWILLAGAGALVIAFVLALTNRRDRTWGALAGGLVGWTALNLSWPASPDGATALLAAAAVVPLWWSAYRVARRSTQRRVRWTLGALGAFFALGIATAAVFALMHQGELRRSAQDTERAARQVAAGRSQDGEAGFVSTSGRFRSVADAAQSWWMLPTRLVPFVAQNVTAVARAAESGAELNDAAAIMAASVDYDELQLEGGRIDLALLASFAEPVRATEITIAEAQDRLAEVDSPWLLGPLGEQLGEFELRLAEAREIAETADAAVADVPVLLGADGPRRYLLLLGNPAEARDLGGHAGTWAELVASEGKLDVVEVGDAYDLFGPGSDNRPVLDEAPAELRPLLDMAPTRFPQNWTATADLATAAPVLADLFVQVRGGAPIDGVGYADPVAMAALLESTGPVEADGVRLEAQDAVRFFTVEQFRDGERSLTPAVRAALEAFTENRLPAPSRLAELFDHPVDRGHLQFVTLDEAGSEVLDRVGLDRRVRADEGVDTLLVLTSNANPSKIDAYLERSIDYLVDWSPATGDLRSRVVVTLRNTAPADGLHPVVLGSGLLTAPGTNRTQLSVLSGQQALGVMVDGASVPWSTRPDAGGLSRTSVQVDVAPGGQRTVVFDLVGVIAPGARYRVDWFNQPLIAPDESRLVLASSDRRLPGGAQRGQVVVGTDRVETIEIEAR